MDKSFLAQVRNFVARKNLATEEQSGKASAPFETSGTAPSMAIPTTDQEVAQEKFSEGFSAVQPLAVPSAEETVTMPSLSPPLGFHFNAAKVEGKGEDSDPIAEWDQKQGVLAVFDGLGGAGSTIHHHRGVAYTGAYIASRVAMSEIRQLYNSVFEPRLMIPVDTASLRNQMEEALKREAATLETESEPTRLKSKLIKRLPTTMAALFMAQIDEETLRCQAVWAGDSRCYNLSPHTGLQQLSKDDIKSGGDALDNLKNDSPLSNYLNADTKFELHSQVWTFPQPHILLAATDGCFGYLLSPAHFEFLLLDSLAQANSTLQWRAEVINRLGNIAGDDCSMALLALGWSSFDALKAAFHTRHRQLHQDFIQPLDTLTQEIERDSTLLSEVESRKNEREMRREALRQELWQSYKTTHDQHIHIEIGPPKSDISHPAYSAPEANVSGTTATECETAIERAGIVEQTETSQSQAKDLET